MRKIVKNLSDGGLAEDVYAAMGRILDEDTNKEKMVNNEIIYEDDKVIVYAEYEPASHIYNYDNEINLNIHNERE